MKLKFMMCSMSLNLGSWSKQNDYNEQALKKDYNEVKVYDVQHVPESWFLV